MISWYCEIYLQGDVLEHIKYYSLIEELTSHGIHFFHKDGFNFSSAKKNEISKVSVCLFENSSKKQTQLIYSNSELIDIKKIKTFENDQELSLNRKFSPRESIPFGKFIFIQPFFEKQNVKTLISSAIKSSKYLIVSDSVKNQYIIVKTEDFLSLFNYRVISFEQNVKEQVEKITLNVGMDAIERVSKDSTFGSISIKDSHIETQSLSNIDLSKKVVIPIFPSTSEEILIISDENSFVDIHYIESLFGIDHLLETAYLIKAHTEYPELKNFSINISQVISYVGVKKSFQWMIEIAEISQPVNMNEDFIEFYFKFASFINVASEVCSNIVSFIMQQETSLKSKDFDPSKMLMVSRLINFPSVLLSTNSSRKDYNDVVDHIIINPTHNAMEICDVVLGYNEVDLVSSSIAKNMNLPDFIKNTLLEQYNPMYNGADHLYPNLNYIASNLMLSQGIMQSSIFAPSKKMAYALADRIGISRETLLKTEEKIMQFKQLAIQKNRIHSKKKKINQETVNNQLAKYTLAVF